MTKKGKGFITAIVALISSFTVMVLLHVYGPGSAFMLQPAPATHSMTDMAWMMVLGALAMILFFGGIVTLIILFVQFLTGRSRQHDLRSDSGA